MSQFKYPLNETSLSELKNLIKTLTEKYKEVEDVNIIEINSYIKEIAIELNKRKFSYNDKTVVSLSSQITSCKRSIVNKSKNNQILETMIEIENRKIDNINGRIQTYKEKSNKKDEVEDEDEEMDFENEWLSNSTNVSDTLSFLKTTS